MNTDHRSSLLTLQNFTWTQYLRVKLGLLTILTQFHSVTVSSPVHLFTCWPGHLLTGSPGHLSVTLFTPELSDTNTWASRNSTTTFSLLQRAAIFLRLLPSTKRHVTALRRDAAFRICGKTVNQKRKMKPVENTKSIHDVRVKTCCTRHRYWSWRSFGVNLTFVRLQSWWNDRCSKDYIWIK